MERATGTTTATEPAEETTYGGVKSKAWSTSPPGWQLRSLTVDFVMGRVREENKGGKRGLAGTWVLGRSHFPRLGHRGLPQARMPRTFGVSEPDLILQVPEPKR